MDVDIIVPVVVPVPDQPTARGGVNNFANRTRVKNYRDPRAKLVFLHSMRNDADGRDGTLNENARKWKQTTFIPIINCLEKHCGGDVDLFCAKWFVDPLVGNNEWGTSLFAKNCCRGSDVCGCG
jgi:hypothetical protein